LRSEPSWASQYSNEDAAGPSRKRYLSPFLILVVNRYPAEADVATETNVDAIERWGRVPVLCVCPDEPFTMPQLPPGVASAVGGVDWWGLARLAN
jgi:hypothetical protein